MCQKNQRKSAGPEAAHRMLMKLTPKIKSSTQQI